MWGLVEKKNMQLLATFDMNIIVANAPMNINQHKWWVKVNCNHLLTCLVVFSFFNDPKCSCWTIYPTTQCLEKKNTITLYSQYIYITQSALGAVCWEMVCIFGATHYILAVTPLKRPSDRLRSTLRKVLLYLRESPSRWNTFIIIYIYLGKL